MGQNNDESLDFITRGDRTTLSIHKQPKGPDVLNYTYAGAPASMGINSSGLCLCGNALPYEGSEIGVPILCVAREILNQTDLTDAIKRVKEAKIAVAANLAIGTTEGITNVEANPDKVQVSYSETILFHANHYLCSTKDFSDKIGKDDGVSVSSLARCNRMESLMKANSEKLELFLLQGFLRDHENRPYSICAHKSESGSPIVNTSKTIDSMIFIPEEREAWIAKGNPCENKFVSYRI